MKLFAGAVAVAATLAAAEPAAADADAFVNPVLGDAGAIAHGRTLYRQRCYICHLSEGGKGPNLFATKLSDEAFLETAINGRGTMPAMGAFLSPDEIWEIHAFLRSHERYE